MKNFLFATTLICSLAVMFFVNQTSKNNLSELQIENIQALSQNESSKTVVDCFANWTPLTPEYTGYYIEFTSCNPCGKMYATSISNPNKCTK